MEYGELSKNISYSLLKIVLQIWQAAFMSNCWRYLDKQSEAS